ncbi:hypothetical protein HOLleu_41006 [Holothuria leucospilota]|uniref:Uncharacterized protein n=1 Tax=Holothuria leucospilota TaxID=206669 RepID=A0A9Q0YC05_HOLLE|nr:hypothetical protein HOLleu_41006 [Holothuria leucospilota]
MAISRILTTIATLFLTLLVVTVWSYPMSTADKFVQKENQEGLYKDLFHALASKVDYGSSGNRNRQGPVDGFGSTRYNSASHDLRGFRWTPEHLKMLKELQGEVKEDVGKRDYGDLGFFFGKRANSGAKEEDALQRQNRDYGDLGMFFGKRSGTNANEGRNVEFADFAA